jgi:hypothetical protein
MPIIDRSVHEYLNHVDSLIAENIERGARAFICTTTGTVEVVQGQLSGSLASLMFGAPRGVASHLRDLARNIDTERSRFTTDTKVTEVLLVYGDLLTQGALVQCALGISIDAQPEAKAQVLRLRGPTLEWRLLVGDNRDAPMCRQTHECIVERRAFVEKFVREADPRDKAVAKVSGIAGPSATDT